MLLWPVIHCDVGVSVNLINMNSYIVPSLSYSSTRCNNFIHFVEISIRIPRPQLKIYVPIPCSSQTKEWGTMWLYLILLWRFSTTIYRENREWIINFTCPEPNVKKPIRFFQALETSCYSTKWHLPRVLHSKFRMRKWLKTACCLIVDRIRYI